MPAPPPACNLQPIAEATPACLRSRRQWVCWKYVQRGDKWTKSPVNPQTGKIDDANSAATWGTFEGAVETFRRSPNLAGVGFVFTADDPYCGIDLDDCIDATGGQLKPWGQQIVDALGSYCELSPSGTGVKIYIEGIKPGERCRRPYHDGEVEIYDRGRFFAVTGQILPGGPNAVVARQAELEAVYEQVFGPARNDGDRAQSGQLGLAPPPPPPSHASSSPSPPSADPGSPALEDDQIIDIASRSRSGGKFKTLWAGSWQPTFNSQSEADSSLVFMLAFYTKDAGQLDRLFRASGLMRDKWDEARAEMTYGAATIRGALENVKGQYRPRRPRRPAAERPVEEGSPPDGGEPKMIALGQREPQTGRLVLSPKKTLPTAKAFIEEFHAHSAGRTLHSYAGTVLVWRGNRFVEIEEETVRQRVQPWLHEALRYQFNKQTHEMELVDYESNPGTINSAVESLRAYAHLPAAVTPPCWLSQGADLPDPRYLMPFPTGTLDLSSNKILAPTPALFNINAIDFDYDPHPEPPERWIRFLEQLWGDDLESVQLLQEWTGYCLVADTSQQKMLLMVGPKRSGKGTIGRVLSRLVGAGNVVGPTTSSLAGAFGLQPLIGKSLAIVSDARFGGENVGIVVERLLCISGEDKLTVDRKFLGSLTMKLPTRFVFLTNELPRMNDASGALAGRFVILRLINSFYGQEDTHLTQQLMEELPGILLWAIEGLKRLRARGHFVQPQAVADAVQEMEDLASPVMAFVRECCRVGAGHRVWTDELYRAWTRWCENDGRNTVTHKQTFGRDLSAAVPEVSCRRNSIQGRFYEGIALLNGGPPPCAE